jgi:hypothetical protein
MKEGKQFSRESANILLEAAELQERKGLDYQNPLSRVRQADHYPRGVHTILDTINGKMLRMYSVLETMEQGGKVNFESVEDSAIDMINYASFLVAYMRGDIEGQDMNKDIFNRRINKATHTTMALIPTKFKSQAVAMDIGKFNFHGKLDINTFNAATTDANIEPINKCNSIG